MGKNRRKAFLHRKRLGVHELKSEHFEVPQPMSIKLEYLHLRYDQKIDDFILELKLLIDGQQVRIKGIIDCRYFYGEGRGIFVRTPGKYRSKMYFIHYNTFELWLASKDIPELFKVIVGFVHTTGDYLDDDKYDNSKHGYLEVDCKDNPINVEYVQEHMSWVHQYS